MMDSPRPSEIVHPYPGLRTFRSDEDYLFFGREEQVAELLGLLSKHRFVAVVGTSGSGKSSLVRCGLLSELQGGSMVKAGSHWDIAVMQPGGDPLRRLAQALCDADLYDATDSTVVPQILATLMRSRNGLVEAARQSDLADGSNLLLVVDQFEEIFRFHEAGKKGQEQAPDFVRLLLAACEQSEVPIYVVLTMRSDFLGDCPQFAGLAEAVNHGEYLIPRLTREQSQAAIEGPARVAGGEISRRLVQRLLNDLGSETEQLPVLQHALMRTWDRWLEERTGGEPVDLPHYEAVGGMQFALSRHADEVLEALPDEAHRKMAERIFKALTEKGADGRGIRRPTRLRDLAAIADARPEIVARVIESYRRPGVTFLMPGGDVELGPESVIDISHESLMRVWERLRGWVEEESQSVRIFRRLADTASLWTRREAGFYHDPDLQIATSWRDEARPNAAWAAQYGGGFEDAMSFLEASRSAADAAVREREAARARELEQARLLAQTQARAARNFKRFAAGMLIVAVAALVAMGFAVIAQREAEEARTEVARTLSRSDFIRGASLLDQEQHLAGPGLRLLLDAHTHDSAAPAPLQRIHDVLLNRRLAIAELELSAGGPAVLSLAVQPATAPGNGDPGRTLLAAGDEGGAVRLFELPSGRLLRSLSPGSAVVTLAFSGDGAKLVAATRNGRVYVWNPDTGEEIAHKSEPGYPDRPRLGALAVSPDGNHYLVQLEFSGSRWLAATRISPVEDAGYQRRQPTQAFPCARPLLRRGAGGYLIPDGAQVTRLEVGGGFLSVTPFGGTETGAGNVSALAANATGARFAVAKGPELRVIESAGAATSSRVLARSTSQIVDLDFSPDGRRIVVVEDPGGARILDVESGEVLTALPREASLARAWFDPRGLLVLTVTVESEARVWLAETGEPVSAVFTHEGPYDINPFIDGGSRLLVREPGNSLRILRSVSVPSLPLTLAHPSAVRGIAMDRTGALLASACADGTVRVWNAAEGTLQAALPLEWPVRSVAFSPDGTRLLACAESGDIRFWNVSDWSESLVIRTESHELRIASAELSGDGRTVLATLEGGLGLDLFDSVSGRRRCPILRTEQAVTLAAVSSDGRFVAAGTADGKVLSWSVDDLGTPREIEPQEGAIVALGFHPRENRFLFVTGHGALRIVDGVTGEASSVSEQEVVEASWSPDGKSIVTRSANEAIRLWDVASGALMSTALSRSVVLSASLGPTSDRLLRVGRDAVEVLDARTAQSLARHTIPGGRITQAQLTPDGHGVVAVAADGTVFFWDAGYEPGSEVDGALIRLAESALGGSGTEEPRGPATAPATKLAATGRLLRWYSAAPEAQTLSPSRDLPLATWLDGSFARRDTAGLRWSLLLRPDKPIYRAQLALMRLRNATPSSRDLFYSRLEFDDAAVKSSEVAEVAVLRALGLEILGDAGGAAAAWARAAALGESDLAQGERWIALIDAVEREGVALGREASASRDALLDRAIPLSEGAAREAPPTLTRLLSRRFELLLDRGRSISDPSFARAREEWAQLRTRVDLPSKEAERLLQLHLEAAGRALGQASLAERREHEAFFAATALLRWLAPIHQGDLSLEENKRPAFQTLPELAGPTTPLIEKGSTWRYLDDGSDQGTRWREPDHDDSAWKEGMGPLGFGDPHIKTSIQRRPSSDPDGSQVITHYFRRPFELEEIPKSPWLLFDVLRDDGVILYVNGVEVFRDNLPPGPIDATTLAVRALGGEDETTYLAGTFPLEDDGRSLLKKGRNLIAAEVHQSGLNSSDLGLDLALAVGWAPDGYLDSLSDERWDAILAAMEGLLPVALDASLREAALWTFSRDPASMGKPGSPGAWLSRARFLRTRGARFWPAALEAAERAVALAQEMRAGSVDARLLLEPPQVLKNELLTRLGRPGALGPPGRDPALDRSLIDLGALYNASYFPGSFDWHDPENALGRMARVPWVVTSLRGVRYDVRGLIQLNSGRYPNDGTVGEKLRGKNINEYYGKQWPDQVRIPLGRRARSMGFLGSTILGRGDDVNAGEDPIARYVFHYQDGSSVEEPVRWRRDAVDWWRYSLGDLRSLGWFDRGPSGNGEPFSWASFSEKIWRNPHPEKVITSIDFVSAKIAAAPFLLGVTVIEE